MFKVKSLTVHLTSIHIKITWSCFLATLSISFGVLLANKI